MPGDFEQKKFEEQISPNPISGCDLLSKLLDRKTEIKQVGDQFPKIKIDELDNLYGKAHPLMQRAQCACQLSMVVNPHSFFDVMTSFIPKDQFTKCYQDAAKEHNEHIKGGMPLGKPRIG